MCKFVAVVNNYSTSPEVSTIFKIVHICLMLEGRNLDDFGLRFFRHYCFPADTNITAFTAKVIKINRIFVTKKDAG